MTMNFNNYNAAHSDQNGAEDLVGNGLSGRDHEQDLRDALSGADRHTLRRAAADGEDGAQAALDAMSEGDSDADHRAAHNETTLRHAVGRVMGQQAMPEHLRLRVIAALAESAGTTTSNAASSIEKKPAGFNGVLARIGRPLAAAAVLALGGIAVFQGVQNANPSGGQTASVVPTGQLQELINYVAGRHGGAITGTYESSTVTATEGLGMVETAVGSLTPALTQGVQRISDAGYTISVVKVCQVPNAVTSAHIMLTPPAGAGSAEPVSVFVQSHGPDASACLLKQLDGESCYLCPESRKQGRTFAFWRDGDFVLHVISTSEQSFEELLGVLQAPSDRVDLR